MILVEQPFGCAAAFTILIAGVFACSEDPPDSEESPAPIAGAARVARVALTPMTQLAAWPQPRTVRRFDVSEVRAGWEVEAKRYQLLPRDPDDPDAGSELVMAGVGARSVSLNGRFVQGEFDRVDVELSSRIKEGVRLSLRQGNRRVNGCPYQDLPGGDEVCVLSFSVPDAAWTSDEAQVLRISFEGKSNLCRLRSVSLLRRPLAALLPPPDVEPSLLFAGTEARRGWALAAGSSLEGMLESTTRASHLRWSVMIPDAAAGRSPPLELTVELRDPHGEVHRSGVALEDEAGAWTHHQMELPFEGEAELEFRLTRTEGEDPPDEPAVCAVAEVQVLTPGSEQGTVVLVTSDTHRGDHLSLTGQTAVETPFLDALAERSAVFLEARSTINMTRPSHTALLTGIHPRDHGLVNNTDRLQLRARTLAEAFAEAGWSTRAVVSVSILDPRLSGLGQGFDRVSVPESREVRAGVSVDTALHWLDESGELPLFLWMHLFDAHAPYDPPPSFADRQYDSTIDPWDPELPEHPDRDLFPRYLEEVRDIEYPKAMYRGELNYLDQELGRFLAHPRLETAALGLTGDHGEALGEHAIYFQHVSLYPQVVHVPLILFAPGVTPRRIESARTHLDLGRTLLDLAGLHEVPFPGRDLLVVEDEPVFAMHSERGSASIEEDGWLLILHLAEHIDKHKREVHERHRVELFHRSEDPMAEHDLVRAAEHRSRALVMRQHLVEWLDARSTESLREVQSVSSATRQMLEDLGYVVQQREEPAPNLDPDCECEWCQRFK